MRYCGVVATGSLLQLAMLEELRTAEPPIRLDAVFFEPASAAQVARELRGLPERVVAGGGPQAGGEGGPGGRAGGGEGRLCDRLVRERGVAPEPLHPEIGHLFHELHEL